MARPPNLGHFPDTLKGKRRWITWRATDRNGRTTKAPQQRVNTSNEWLTLGDACARVTAGSADGIGYVLGDGVAGIDLDHVIASDGTLHEIAQDALALGSYAEQSPSGRGLHVLLRATVARSQNIRGAGVEPGREVYDGGRYFTVTGERVGSATQLAHGEITQAKLDAFVGKWFPITPKPDTARAHIGATSSDDEVLALLFKAKDVAKWRRVFEGDWSNYPSQSEADLALCRKFRFYTLANRATIDRLFRRSGLMRPKWDERHGETTYGEQTIAKALAQGGHVYKGERSFAGRTERAPDVFGILPAWVRVALKDAGEVAFRMYGALAEYADATTHQAYPTIATLAADCEITPGWATKTIAKLVARRVVFVTRRPRSSSLYVLPRTVSESDTLFAQGACGTLVPPHSKKGVGLGSNSGTLPRSILLDKQTIVDTGEREMMRTTSVRARDERVADEGCAFFIGSPSIGGSCQRCGRSWEQHARTGAA